MVFHESSVRDIEQLPGNTFYWIDRDDIYKTIVLREENEDGDFFVYCKTYVRKRLADTGFIQTVQRES